MNARTSILPVVAAFILAACGDTIENQINQTGMEVVTSEDDLPKCAKDNEGELAFVKGESFTRICVDGDWIALGGEDGSEFGCKTVELKDKSGLKIVCNGDSIGVVLNGKKGKDGENGENGADGKDGVDGKDGTDGENGKDAFFPQDTLEADSERVAISLDSLVGFTQKGPFLNGSTVYLYELSDGRTLKQTNGNFMSKITSDDGRYKFSARNLVSQYAMVVVEGDYRNEVSGGISDAPIRLTALTDMRKRSSVNVNLLTHIEFDRVYNLVTHGDSTGKKLTVRQAKRQAQKEVLKQFYIELEDSTDAEDMDVFGDSDADAALLAVSVLLQGDLKSSALSILLTDLSNDIAGYGNWNNATERAKLAEWALTADTAGRLAVFSQNVTGWGFGKTSDFEKYIRRFVSIESGLGICGSDSIPAGLVKYVPNPIFRGYYATEYVDTDSSDVRFICVDSVGKFMWRVATDIEKDTMTWGHDFEDGEVRNGRINTNLTYVYQDGNWRLGTSMDRLLVSEGGTACLIDGDTSKVKYENEYYVCTSDTDGAIRGWKKAPDIYNDTYEERDGCTADGKYSDGTVLTGRVNTDIKYVCDAGEFRVADKTNELVVNRGCTSYTLETYTLVAGYYKCESDGWHVTTEKLNEGIFIDSRDSIQYKTIGIGTQMWMAENLRYNAETLEKEIDGVTYRYYTWNTAKNGLCPSGWRLPSSRDWELLYSTIGNSPYAIQAKNYPQWPNATDAFGFTAVPVGQHVYGNVSSIGSVAGFWSSNGLCGSCPIAEYWDISKDKASLYGDERSNGRSVRCVKNSL